MIDMTVNLYFVNYRNRIFFHSTFIVQSIGVFSNLWKRELFVRYIILLD